MGSSVTKSRISEVASFKCKTTTYICKVTASCANDAVQPESKKYDPDKAPNIGKLSDYPRLEINQTYELKTKLAGNASAVKVLHPNPATIFSLEHYLSSTNWRQTRIKNKKNHTENKGGKTNECYSSEASI